MIIFSVAQGENKESDQITFDLTSAYVGIATNKEPVRMYRHGHGFDCIVIKDKDYGMKLAAQYNQPFVLIRDPDKTWHVIDPKTEEIYSSFPGFKRVSEDFLAKNYTKLYIRVKGKPFVPRKGIT